MPTKPNGCGYHNPYGVTLDMPNGESEATTSIGEFPWVVAILDYARRTEKIYGGTLIAPNVVLTAAHSLRGKAAEDLRVIAGEWDPQRTTEAYPNQTILVKEIIIHESYSVSAPFYNIALLLLQNHFRLDVHINPICLPDTQVRFDFENCYAAGWQKGAFFADNTNSPAMLQKEKLSVIPHTDCQNTLRKRTSEYFELHHHFICAGGGEKYVNACVGNAGTALMCPIKNSPNRYYIAGIDSWNLGCNKENTPEVFVSVTKLRLWIAWKLNNHAKREIVSEKEVKEITSDRHW
ncbi:phenoloxidase-activating factor 2-like [Scaptodrosophila lebanonensis]|uniref:Phenoloxidase-activating factor 2-like n=1 Tax=Drosophila lebanonensis TaxID=7225 RepID=A0A6J2TP70_DROLE|nr:phenoloxidase-activating factor 2-like [Scaptodrosophila lebanonensis]